MPEGETQPTRELPEWTKTEQFAQLTTLIIPSRNDKDQIVASEFARKDFAFALADLGDAMGTIVERTAKLRPGPQVGPFTTEGLESIADSPLTNSEKTLATIVAAEALARLMKPQNETILSGTDLLTESLTREAERTYGTTPERKKAITRIVKMAIGLPFNNDDSTNAPLKAATERALGKNKPLTDAVVSAAGKTRDAIAKYGTYPRAEYDPGNPPEDIRAHEYRTRRLRIPFLREFFAAVSKIRQFKNEIAPILGRRKDFARGTQEQGETHRTLAALFSGIYQSPHFSWLIDKTIDRATETESGKVESLIRAGYSVVDTLVVGSGLHASVFAAELRYQTPEAEVLLVDGGDRLGGQFAEAETEKYFLNSRTRPENRFREPVPGKRGNLNSLGPHAVVQVPDLTGETYTSQRTLARAIRTNDILSAPALIRSTVTGIQPLSEGAQRRFGAMYAVNITVRGPDGERGLVVYTNRVINMGGLGEEAFPGVDVQSGAGKRIIDQAKRDLVRGVTPKVLHSSWYWKATGNGANEFPRKDFTGDVMVIGEGDSAYTVLEDLLGYGPDKSASVHQLDWPQNITWVGQDAADKGELLKKLRTRYARISLDMPRPNYNYSRINPESGRAITITEGRNGRITVEWETDTGTERKEVDRVIFATGYQDRSPTIIDRRLFQKRLVEEDDIYNLNGTIRPQFIVPGAVFESPLGITKARIVSVSQRTITLAVSTGGGEEEIQRYTKKEFVTERFGRVTIPSPTLISATEPVRVGSRTIARRIPGQSIYYGGTSAQIPVQRGDGINESFFEIIPENTAAAFLTVPRTVRFARQIAEEIRERQRQPDTAQKTTGTSLIGALTGIKQPPKLLKTPLWRRVTGLGRGKPLISERFYSKPSPLGSFLNPRVAAQLPRALDQETWLHITVGTAVSNFRFPPRAATYTLRIRREDQFVEGEEFFKPFVVTTDAPIDADDPDWKKFAETVTTNPDFLAILDKRTRQPKTRTVTRRSVNANAGEDVEDRINSEAVLTIPVDGNGAAIIDRITLEPR